MKLHSFPDIPAGACGFEDILTDLPGDVNVRKLFCLFKRLKRQ